MSEDATEYAARLAFKRNVHQTLCELYDQEISRIGQKLGMQEAEKKESLPAVKEETFTILKFEDAKGSRLGDFQIAHKSNNLPDKWSPAYHVLRQNNAVINSRYHGPDYEFSYWLYGEDRIFRQRLKKRAEGQ